MKFVLNLIKIFCGLLSGTLLLAFLYYTIAYQQTMDMSLQTKANIILVLFVLAFVTMALSFILSSKENSSNLKLYRVIDSLSGKVEALVETRLAPTNLHASSDYNTDDLAQSVIKLNQGIQLFNEKNIAALEAFSAQVAFINQQQNVLSYNLTEGKTEQTEVDIDLNEFLDGHKK